VDAFLAQLAVAQAGDGIVFIKALMCLGGAFDMPFDQRGVQGLGNLVGQHGLASAGFTLHQQGPAQQHCGIDRDLQVFGGDVAFGTLETLCHRPSVPSIGCITNTGWHGAAAGARAARED
jgi:hypothetical protein